MTHDDLVFEALANQRNLGADFASVKNHVRFREGKKCTTKSNRAALERLTKAGLAVQVGQKWFLTLQGLKLARGPARHAEWLPEDSWILLSLLICNKKEGCDLKDIIGTADYIDRSIPTLEQMHGALNRLAAGGLVRTRRGLYLVTEKATGIFAKVKTNSRRAVRSRLRGLERILECPCCGVELKKVRWKIVIEDADMKEAHQSYINP